MKEPLCKKGTTTITINSEPPKPTTFEDLGYVQVVRCKDCIYAESFMESYKCYFDEENEYGCKRSHDADFFCAYGERK